MPKTGKLQLGKRNCDHMPDRNLQRRDDGHTPH